jgi:hypothetical protein
MPMVTPLSKSTETVYNTLRVGGADWETLAIVIAYSLVLSTFLFLLSDLVLRRKNLI